MTDPSLSPAASPSAVDAAAGHLQEILCTCFEQRDDADALVVWDANSELACIMTEAYRRCLPRARYIEFEALPPERILAAFGELQAGSLVVLIQSQSFRLDAYRIRLELFKRSLKVIEHPHLERMGGSEALIYIDALAYDKAYYRGVGQALKRHIDAAQETRIDSGGEQLVFACALEPAKLNVGDYSHMQNVGGQFPIGEVFSEAQDLEAVAGRVRIAFFGDTNFRVNRPEAPITLIVQAGRVVDALHSTPEFEQVLASIRATEGQVWLREVGFGMNRALSPTRSVNDIGTFERMCGIHLSLGAKHASYNKPNIRKRDARHHVDVFAITEGVYLDGKNLFQHGAWHVEGEPASASC